MHKYDKKKDTLYIFLQEDILSGYYSLHISFNGSLDDDEVFLKTFYINGNGQKMWLVATQTFAARQLFPCWDVPILKATFNISIKHYDSYKTLSNMPVQAITKDNNKMQWTHFKTPAMPTYCIGFILHNFFFMPDINLWCKPPSYYELLFANNVIRKITTYFENWETFKKVPYIQHVVIPGFRYNIYDMDKCNLIFYRETTVIYNERFDPVARKIEVARLIARKITYQWLDNQINSTSSNFWLHQGVAMLLGTNIVNKSFSDFRMMDLFVVQIQQESLRLDSDPHFHLPFSYHIKASAILRILQHILTDEKFQYGIEIFYNMSTISTTLDDFWKAMQKAYDEESRSVLNIKEKMDPWTKLEHYPVLMVRQYPNLIISIENINSSVLDKELNILVTITKETAPDFTVSMDKPSTFWISLSNIATFYFLHDLNEWIIVNTQQIGYYRVNYETNNWLNIARYLNNITLYKKIHVLNRAQIIDDAYYFMKTGQMNLSTFLNLTEYLSHETDYVAWYPMFKALEDMSNIFLFSSEEINHLKEKIAESLYKLLQRITYNETPIDNELTKCLRQEAAKWLCVFGHLNCKNAAQMKLNKYLRHNERNEILPWWKEWIYCNGLTVASTAIWDKVSQAYTQKLDKKILKFLSCSKNPFVMNHKMLTKVPKDHLEKIQHNDYIFYFHNIIEKHARNEIMLVHILENLMNIKPKQFNTITALIDIINHVYSENVLNTITSFVENTLMKSELTIITEMVFINSEINKYVRTLMKKRILFIHHKIKIRLSQIKSQKSRFHFTKNGKQ
ncbi:aminopeptidase Ey-like isoform X2 [Formica exsecta]|nr:aminopeptidase Ey-like isoform X2 [Formica exsecta]